MLRPPRPPYTFVSSEAIMPSSRSSSSSFLFAACFASLIFIVVSVSAWGSGCDIYRSSFFFVVVYSALRSRRRQPPPVRCLRLCNPYENYKDLGSVYILSTSRIHHGLCLPINVLCEVLTLHSSNATRVHSTLRLASSILRLGFE